MGAIKKVMLTIGVLALSVALFVFAVGTTGRDGAVAKAVDSVIGQVNTNIETVTGIANILPTFGNTGITGATGGAATQGSQGTAGTGMWN